jgi:SAM-dependent methyltransferase
MGVWSRMVGEEFLAWLSPAQGLSWIDVGAGNGAFTALLAERVKPSFVLGVDPSPAQLAFAKTRAGVEIARFEEGNAMELPAADNSADAAAMALAIAFVPDPAKGVAEMVRAVKPGGLAAAYMWDWPEGFPYYALEQVTAGYGLPVVAPPSSEASLRHRMEELWHGAGLQDVASREITVERSFSDFDTLWAITLTGPRMSAALASMTPDVLRALRSGLRERLGAENGKPISLRARANAVKGWVPG